jgi:phosphomannomutase/phosphoglucomutase
VTPEQKGLKLVVDAGNAIPGIFYPNFLRSFGHEVKELFCDLDTTFPNHQPDPERVENLELLQKEMASGKHDLGLAFDGDGDRVGILLQDGTMLSADKILYVLGSDFLSRHPGASIVLDAMSSQLLITKLEAKGANVILSQTGHSHIEHAMHDNNALLGGEQSGHFMFGENFYGHDDALLAVLRFIQALQTNPELEIEVTVGWDKMLEISERITVADEEKFQILDNVIADLKEIFPDASTLDGIRIDFGQEEWAIIRCSNTSPKIAVRLEARNQESLDEKKEILMGVLEKHR